MVVAVDRGCGLVVTGEPASAGGRELIEPTIVSTGTWPINPCGL